MKVGILGSGIVAQTLGSGFLQHGHQVMLGTRSVVKLAEWQSQNDGAAVGSFAESAAFGEVVIVAVKGSAAYEALHAAEAVNLGGKPVIDAANPIADDAPVDGVLRFFTSLDESLMERLQREFPAAKFVKAFSSVGSLHMVNPDFDGGPPTMFICGDDDGAKATVTGILDQFGWEAADMGGAVAARAIEPLCMLWCIPGLRDNAWGHAFKLLQR